MSYRISVSYTVPNPDDRLFFTVEKTVHAPATSNGGTWSVANEQNVLACDVNGGSGCLRLTSDIGEESFIAAFGFDQEMPWSDIVPNLAPTDTALTIHPQYYTQPDRIAACEAHRTSLTVTSSAGTSIAINLTGTHGRNLKANVIIG